MADVNYDLLQIGIQLILIGVSNGFSESKSISVAIIESYDAHQAWPLSDVDTVVE